MSINQNDFKFLEKFRFWGNARYKDISTYNASDFLRDKKFTKFGKLHKFRK